MLNDPLVIRYRNDAFFHNLVDRVRQVACEARLSEPTWRDAVCLAFQMERERGMAVDPNDTCRALLTKISNRCLATSFHTGLDEAWIKVTLPPNGAEVMFTGETLPDAVDEFWGQFGDHIDKLPDIAAPKA